MAGGTNFLWNLNFVYRVISHRNVLQKRRENWREIVRARYAHIDTAELLSRDINII